MYFVTGSSNKFQEAQLIISNLQQIDIDLPEIQEIDPHKIISEKLKAAFQQVQTAVVVEDTGLYFNNLNGLPGPLVKWFLKTIENTGLAKLAFTFGDIAQAKTIVGYTEDGINFHFFEGIVEGKIVEPRGDKGFGWDPVFEVNGQTFAEMNMEEKNEYSMRKIAFQKLNEFLSK